MSKNSTITHAAVAGSFCRDFLDASSQDRFVFGTNNYAESIANQIEIAGFINDTTDDTYFLDKPIVKISSLPKSALVVSAVTLGRPLTALSKLSASSVRHLDYFAFYENSGLKLEPVTFWADFNSEYENNHKKFSWIEGLLSDDISRKTYKNIMDFRTSANIEHMEGYVDRQKEQYWEDFLELKEEGEVFVDVGSFDGFTTEEFIKRCPKYEAAYVFEPEAENMLNTKSRLGAYENIRFLELGLSNEKGIVRFSKEGSSSGISGDGSETISVDKLDNCVDNLVTYIKMDIEGAEGIALEGAKETILKSHPKLAICVYHKADCLWRIPEQILAIRDDYNIYLRHYTEGVVESVMFFIPKK